MGHDDDDAARDGALPPDPWAEVARALELPFFVVEDPVAGTLGWVSPSTAALFGFDSPEAAVGRSVKSAYDDGRERAEAYTHFVAAIRAGKPPTIQFEAVRCRVDTGEPFPVLLRVHAQLDASGRPRRFLCMAEDLSERRQVDQRFREGDARFKVLFDESPVPILLVHPEGTIVRANQAAARFLGRDVDALGGQALSALASQPRGFDGPPSSEAREVAFRRPDGREVWAAVAVSTEPAAPGQMAYRIVVIQDIDARRRMEEELRRRERVAAIGDLAAGIAHDFNNALAGVLGALEMADTAADSATWVEQARAGVNRSRDLVQRIATLAAGGRPVTQVVAVRPLLDRVVAEGFAGRALPQLSIEPTVTGVRADPVQLGEALRMLLRRARAAATEEGSVQVRARSINLAAESALPLVGGAYTRIEIEDPAPCPPPSELRRFFQPAQSEGTRGDGFALATAASILERHGGRLWAEPSEGGGTCLVALIPSATLPDVAPQAPPAPTASPLRVLVMDDDALVRSVTVSMLQRLGHEVAAAADGDEALEMARKALASRAPFDVAILDLTIPGGKGGLEVVRPLATLDPRLRAIVSSGYCEEPVMADPPLYGFCAALPKPYTRARLEDVLQRCRPETS